MDCLNCDLGGFRGWAEICVGRGLSESGFAGLIRIFRMEGDRSLSVGGFCLMATSVGVVIAGSQSLARVR